MNAQRSPQFEQGGLASRLARLRVLPDTVFGRLLLIVVASVGVPDAIALFIAPEEHRVSLLGALCLLLPPVALGVYFAARSITRPLAQLTNEAESLGRGVEGEPVNALGPREVRALSNAFEMAQSRVHSYVSNRSRALAAVSHDLKAPLTRMQLRVATLSDDVAREKLERDIEELSSMIRSVIAMLKDLEDPESVESIDINELLARLQFEYAEMGRTVAVTGRARRPYVGRVQSLRRCLTNLIDNAVWRCRERDARGWPRVTRESGRSRAGHCPRGNGQSLPAVLSRTSGTRARRRRHRPRPQHRPRHRVRPRRRAPTPQPRSPRPGSRSRPASRVAPRSPASPSAPPRLGSRARQRLTLRLPRALAQSRQ
jgi:hypothetical protein